MSDSLSREFNELWLFVKSKKREASDVSSVLSPLLFPFLISCMFPRQAEPLPTESDAALMSPLGIQHPNTLSEPGGGRSLNWEGDKAD